MEQVADVCGVMLMFTGDCPTAIHTTLMPAVAALLSDTYEPVRTASRGILIAAMMRMLAPVEKMAELGIFVYCTMIDLIARIVITTIERLSNNDKSDELRSEALLVR